VRVSPCRWCCRYSGGAIITFLEAIALFGSPALIAIPARFNVVTTQLLQFFSQPIRAEVAAAYAVPLLLITVALFLVQRKLVSRRGFVALTGKGGERRLMDLGPWRFVMLGYSLFVLSLSVLLPYIVLMQAALAKAWGRGFAWDNLTLKNFTYILFEHETAGSRSSTASPTPPPPRSSRSLWACRSLTS
jgi:iron(III) transport system permease protein